MSQKDEGKVKIEPSTSSPTGNNTPSRNNHRNKNNNKRTTPPVVKFEGKCEQLKGYIYDCLSHKMADMYMRTTNEIAEYIGTNYKNGGDIRLALLNLRPPVVPLPADPPAGATQAALYIWQKKCDQWHRREEVFISNVQQAYSLIIGQCTEAMKDRLQALPTFENIEQMSDAISLLREIKTISFDFQAQKYTHLALCESMKRFYLMNQHPNMTNQAYLERFKNNLDVIEYCGGKVGDHPGLVRQKLTDLGYDPDAPTDDQRIEASELAREEYIATCFFHGADRQQYGQLIRDYENSFIEGHDRFPKTLTDAYNLLVKYKQPKNRSSSNISDGVNFVNSGEESEEADGTTLAQTKFDKSKVKCNKCGRMGHYANECNETKHIDGTLLLMTADFGSSSFMFHQTGEEINDSHENNDNLMNSYVYAQPDNPNCLPDNWILLDNGSTIDVFKTGKLLKDVKESHTRMRIHCNAGTSTTNLIGQLPGYGEVWFHPEGIANILSLYNLTKKFRVTFDSANEDGFVVHKADGHHQYFKPSNDGLYYLNTDVRQKDSTLLLNTVKKNENRFTKRDILRAQAARKLQNTIGRPPLRRFIEIVKFNLLPNCTTTIQDIINAELIYGPNLGSLKGKTPRTNPPAVTIDQIDLPPDILSLYKDVTLSGDIMFLNKTAFLVTISHKIKFSTAEALNNRKQSTIFSAVRHVLDIYKRRGFCVTFILMDGEFECLRADLLAIGVSLNTTANDEHSPVIERFIRTIKDGVRSISTVLPYKKLPTIMLTDLVYHVIFWKNAFPHKDNIDHRLSPRTIVTGMHIDFKSSCQLEFGQYVQTHEDHDNTLQERTAGAIALRPMGNVQGGWYFMSLQTGRRLRRFHWTPLPIPTDVVDRVHKLARRNHAQRDITFYYRDGTTPITDIANDEYAEPAGVNDNNDDDTDDDTYDPNDDSNASSSSHNSSDNNSDTDSNDSDDSDGNVDYHSTIPDPINTEIHNATPPEDNNDNHTTVDAQQNDNNSQAHDFEEITGVNDQYTPDPIISQPTIQTSNDHVSIEDFERKMDEQYGPRTREGMRDRKPRDYSHLFFHMAEKGICTPPQSFSHVRDMYGIDDPIMEALVATQYTVDRGVKLWGERGVDAVDIELRQLHDRKVGKPVMRSELTPEIRRLALRYLMFLKEKRSGKIKGRGCADGRSQREYISNEEATSPTAHIESLIITCIVDAMENRDVATVDIPGAFMQADTDEDTYVKIQGAMCDIFVKIDPQQYAKFVCVEQGKKTLYLKLEKALYGTIRAARLFYEDLTSTLKGWGFSLNPYDACVANKCINGHQCTIIWHVDDLKISHVDPDVVTEVINKLNDKYGKLQELVATRGKIHDFLGMTLDYTNPGKVKVHMKQYIENIIKEAPDEFSGTAPTPAANHLFQIDEPEHDIKFLSATNKQLFHHITAQLLYLSKRTRPDIQTAIAFLSTRVSKPDIHDWKKLGRVIRYLRGSINLELTLQAENLNLVKWWADGAFAVHRDMRSHTGAVMTVGKGAAYATSKKQKLNTKSSTEAELVAVDDVLAQVIWTRNFINAQGHTTGPSTLYQDNQSAILLEENGMASSSRRTRHINIRYFFVKDKVDSKEITIKYCPTKEMIGDFLTKPLQGAAFRKFRNLILNIEE